MALPPHRSPGRSGALLREQLARQRRCSGLTARIATRPGPQGDDALLVGLGETPSLRTPDPSVTTAVLLAQAARRSHTTAPSISQSGSAALLVAHGMQARAARQHLTCCSMRAEPWRPAMPEHRSRRRRSSRRGVLHPSGRRVQRGHARSPGLDSGRRPERALRDADEEAHASARSSARCVWGHSRRATCVGRLAIRMPPSARR